MFEGFALVGMSRALLQRPMAKYLRWRSVTRSMRHARRDALYDASASIEAFIDLVPRL
jgi:hypothetical protein